MTGKPTWKRLKSLEPLLAQLEQRAETFRDVSGKAFYEHLKGPLCKLVGWSRQGDGDPILRTSEAYDVAYHAIYDLSARSKRWTTGVPKVRDGSLVGRWFHSHNAHGSIDTQGQILESQGENTYLVQYYEWMNGFPHIEALIPHSQMVSENWTFYDTSDAMQDAYAAANSRSQNNK